MRSRSVVFRLVAERGAQMARHGLSLGLTVHPVGNCVAAAVDAVHSACLAKLDLTTVDCLAAEQVFGLVR